MINYNQIPLNDFTKIDTGLILIDKYIKCYNNIKLESNIDFLTMFVYQFNLLIVEFNTLNLSNSQRLQFKNMNYDILLIKHGFV